MAVITPLMNLFQPTIGVDTGLAWEMYVNANTAVIDGHNHTPGNGAQIPPGGLIINDDLSFLGNNAIQLRSAKFIAQMAPLATPADRNCVYVSGVDLYYNATDGTQIQITSGGSVNATTSGISNGTATASFVSSVLVVNSASNTPANIQGASLRMGNAGVSGSFYLTLSPPSALAANYALTLPTIPAQTNVMTLDSSGNMSSVTWDTVAANMSSTGADAIGVKMTVAGADAIATSMNAAATTTILSKTTTASTFAGLKPIVSNTNPVSNRLAIIRGFYHYQVTQYGEGFSVSRIGTGQYVINFTTPFIDLPVIVCSADANSGTYIAMSSNFNTSTTACVIYVYNTASAFADIGFNFIITGLQS